RQSNGIQWCLLAPTQEFAAAMKRFDIPPSYWPFTIEACFSAAVRRQALAESAYAFADTPFSELLSEQGLAGEMYRPTRTIDEKDDASFYLMAPAPEAKERFADWITAAQRITPEIYGAFTPIIDGLSDLVAAAAETQGREGERRSA